MTIYDVRERKVEYLYNIAYLELTKSVIYMYMKNYLCIYKTIENMPHILSPSSPWEEGFYIITMDSSVYLLRQQSKMP